MDEIKTYKQDNIDKEIESSVKQAYINKNPRIITENLDAQFKSAIASKTDKNLIEKNLIASSKSGGMKRSANAFSIDRVFQAPHNPFRNRFAVETPTNLIENIQRYRYYFKYEPLVGTAIELHSEFPLSTFELKHEDPVLQEEFNEIAEELNLFEFQIDMAMEYWLVGEAFPFGIFDNPETPQAWKAFILLNPLFVNVHSVPITDGRPNNEFSLKIDNTISQVVKNGPNHKDTGKLYARIPQDVKDAVNTTGDIQLNHNQISHFKRKGNYFSVRGESILSRIQHLLNYRDKLRDAQYNIADRHSTPKEVWKVGEPGAPATEEELSNLSALISSSFNDPNQVLVYHHALTVDVIGTADKVLPLRQELDGIEEEMLVGLMLNKGFLDSAYGAYANMSVALDVLISRYLTFRQRLERWQKDAVWAPLCRIHNIYKPTPAELSHRIRIKNHDKTPWTPKIAWSKYEMRDSTQKVNLLLQLREKLKVGNKAGYPKDLIYQCVGDNPRMIQKMLDKESKEQELSGGKVNLGPATPGAGGGFGGGGGLPDLSLDTTQLGGGGGAEGAPSGGKGKDISKMSESELPEFNGAGETTNLNSKVMPPESAKIQNEKSQTS